MKTVLVQLAAGTMIFVVGKYISDTYFTGSVAGILMIASNMIISEGMKE
jgi:hypothetical protein